MKVGRHKRNGYTDSDARRPALGFSGIRLIFKADREVVIAVQAYVFCTFCRCAAFAQHYVDEIEIQEVRFYSFSFARNSEKIGGQMMSRKLDLAAMPMYVRDGAIVRFDSVCQRTGVAANKPTAFRIYRRAE